MRQPEDELAALDQASLRRRLSQTESSLVNFSSNDYLGLSSHPGLITALQNAANQYGVGSTASRLICGSSPPHQELESLIAEYKGTEKALSFSSGYATSIGVLTALLKKGDTVIMDKLCHASLIDGARMSQATIRVFPHNHLGKLHDLLSTTIQAATAESRILVITESVFSMDGDTAKLQEICALTQKFNCLLMVDEAHALGVRGPSGMGLAEELGLVKQIDFHMGTLGKAGGVAGGYLAASANWIELLINKSRSFIYSTAPPPCQAAAAAFSLKLIRSEEGEAIRNQLWDNIQLFKRLSGIEKDPESAIIPWLIGDTETALSLSENLTQQGFLVPAIRYPTVPRNTARLRVTVTAAHRSDDIQRLIDCLNA